MNRCLAVGLLACAAGGAQAEVRFRVLTQVSNPFCAMYPGVPMFVSWCALYPPQYGVLLVGIANDPAAVRVRVAVRYRMAGEEEVRESSVVVERFVAGTQACSLDWQPCNVQAMLFFAGTPGYELVSVEAVEEGPGKVVVRPAVDTVY